MVWNVAILGFGTSLAKLTHATLEPLANLQTEGGVMVPPPELELDEEEPPPEPLELDEEPPLELELEPARPPELELLELDPARDPPSPAVVPPELEPDPELEVDPELPPPLELDVVPDEDPDPLLEFDPLVIPPPPSSPLSVASGFTAEQATITAAKDPSTNDERRTIGNTRCAITPTWLTIVRLVD